jgi:hypothetical protein
MSPINVFILAIVQGASRAAASLKFGARSSRRKTAGTGPFFAPNDTSLGDVAYGNHDRGHRVFLA